MSDAHEKPLKVWPWIRLVLVIGFVAVLFMIKVGKHGGATVVGALKDGTQAVEITVGASVLTMVLSVELTDVAEGTYQAVIRDAKQKSLHPRKGLKPSAQGALSMVFPLTKRGQDYTLIITAPSGEQLLYPFSLKDAGGKGQS